MTLGKTLAMPLDAARTEPPMRAHSDAHADAAPDDSVADPIADHFARSLAALRASAADDGFLAACRAVTQACAERLAAGGKLLLAGNGGSAADAQHIAGEFVSRLNFDRAPLAAIALTVDTSVLTAVGNDYGYERVFERQVLALAGPGDVFVGITTSGRSPNILRALGAARRRGALAVAFTGAETGALADLCDLVLAVPSRSTPLIQQSHIVAAHAICGAVEARLFPRDRPTAGREG